MATVAAEKLLSVQEVAQRLGVTDETVYAYMKRGLERAGVRVKIHAVKLGRWRIPEASLAEFLRACGLAMDVDFAGEESQRDRERTEARDRVRKRLGLGLD